MQNALDVVIIKGKKCIKQVYEVINSSYSTSLMHNELEVLV